MKYLLCPPDKSIKVIDDYFSERVNLLRGKDKNALISEFKEWLIKDRRAEDNVWTIPDLTDEGLCDFFKRAISKN
ncbi:MULTISPECIES: hypothetical protein [unclassified Prochlorococcus]|uniref:hypothetical protein n=1 Tax=unclassified Prochlorococcus TaxID=2627481 RepID=UPI0005338AF1|nr:MULTISPECIES: hypothetical protein [unclassified Prochlorococcus]KGG15509.1 hypothetical protein EV06_1383 [Prochlorococcus sp. MIT 0602]KGG17790.1 hypothetical protein EV07_1231 [Prochlorococcus sp. MIT 0603]